MEMTNSQKFWAFMVSRRNLVGLALALFGIVLWRYGIVIPRFGILIVPILYILGVVLTPAPSKQESLAYAQRMTEQEMRGEMDKLVRTVRRKVPRDILVKVESIQDSITSILPQIVQMSSGDKTFYTIRQTALEYLPTALENYLSLPTGFATMYPLRDGKTARQLLGEQLDLLDREMKAIVIDVAANDTQKLLAHGRFLEQKFRHDDIFMQPIKQPEKERVPVQR